MEKGKKNKDNSEVLHALTTKADQTLGMLNAFLNATTDAVFIKDTEGRYLLANQATAGFVGKPVEEIIGHDDFHLFPAVDADFLKKRDRLIMESAAVDTTEESLQIHGVTRTFLATKGAVRDADGNVIGLFGISRDITERKTAEEKIRQLNRVYALLSSVNRAVVRLRDKQQFFDAICRIAVENGKFRMAWIAEIDEETLWVRVAAKHGAMGDYLENIRISINDIPEGQGPTGQTIRSGRHVVSSDIKHDEKMAPWRDNALLHGFRSSASFPITVSGRAIGSLNLYSSEVGFFSDEEVSLLDELAEDISYALQHITAEKALREKEYLLAESQRMAHIGSWAMEIATGKLSWTEETYRIYGRSPEEFSPAAESFISLIHPQDQPLMQAWISACLAGENPRELEFRIVMANGDIRHICGRGALHYDSRHKPIRMVGTAQDITEMKKAEEALQESELRFKSILQTAGDAVIMSDSTGNIVSWNQGAEKIFGYEEPAALNRPLTMLMPERYRCRHIEGMNRVLAGGQSEYLGRIMDFHGIRKDGTEFPLELSVNALPSSRGTYFLGIIREVTEQNLIKTALEEQKRFAEGIIENSTVATFVIDSRHRVLLWNKACEELTGIAAAGIIGSDDQWKPFYPYKRPVLCDVVMENNLADLDSLYKKVSKSPLIANGLRSEGWYSNLNGKDRYIIFDAAPIFGTEDNLLYAIETLQDVTQQKLSEQALQESEHQLKTIINTEPHCVKLISSDITLLEMNPAGLALIEAESFEQVRGRSLLTLIAPEHHKAFQDHVSIIFQGGSATLDFEVIGLKGTRRWLSTHSVPFRNTNGEIVALLGITRDITDQRKLEEQLLHSQKLEGIGQLAGGIAHDFNNILNAVVGFASLAQMNSDSPARLKDYLAEVVAAGQRGASLTHQLLAFSRKQKLDLKEVNLNELINNLMKLLNRLIREDIKLSFIPAGYDLFIMADSSQIDQVLINLTTNARDSIKRNGEITITAETILMDSDFSHLHGFGADGQYALISISDTGTGMDRETLDRIFEPFFTTKEIGKGTGLGLAVVYGIIKQHNGFVNVYSEPGKGATFRIYLPITNAAVDRAKESEIKPPVGGTETILIADDDRALRVLLQSLLEQFGYTVIAAINGVEAVIKFRENREAISLIILDAIMPDKNGQEAYEEISALAPEIKTIFLSGYASDIIDHEALAEKDIPFLTKPILPNALLGKIRELLNG